VKIFALADLHLSSVRPKPMDVFGDLWEDHPQRIAEAWDRTVGASDVVLVPGDISWAHTIDEARPDLEFIAERPGRAKLLLRGNHDSWWTSASKVRRNLPPGLAVLHNDALRLEEGVVICGARGWTLPEMPWFEEGSDLKIYRRELGRLDLSLSAAARVSRPGDRLLAMLHYPPVAPGHSSSEVTARLSRAGIELAAYGHLHGSDDHAWAPQGCFDGVELQFVAADFVGFEPKLLLQAGTHRGRDL
jgi:predicted phosphohydrolase